jgi:antitoxin PrlF
VSRANAGLRKRPQACTRAELRSTAQLTLPEEIRRVPHIGEGDELGFAVREDGTVTIRGYLTVPSDQAWFFAPGRLTGKRQAGA